MSRCSVELMLGYGNGWMMDVRQPLTDNQSQRRSQISFTDLNQKPRLNTAPFACREAAARYRQHRRCQFFDFKMKSRSDQIWFELKIKRAPFWRSMGNSIIFLCIFGRVLSLYELAGSSAFSRKCVTLRLASQFLSISFCHILQFCFRWQQSLHGYWKMNYTHKEWS